jgi:hypothetical protein
MSAPECAKGLRVAQITQALGVDEEVFVSFISDTYSQCQYIGLTPDKIAFNVKEIVELADAVPLSEIPKYIREQTAVKRELEQDIVLLQDQERDAKSKLREAIEDHKTSIAELTQFSNVKTELAKLGMSLHDVPQFVKAVHCMRKLHYDVDRIVTAISNFEAFSAMLAELEKRCRVEDYCSKRA